MASRILNNLKTRLQGKPKPRIPWPEEPLDLDVASGGGYYPAQLGSVLQSSYTLTRKLGWGQHSSVWLAEGHKSQRRVAIKILTAHATLMQGSVAFELPVLQRIKETYGRVNSKTHLMSLYDTFTVKSRHGEHICLVTEALGSTLKEHLNASGAGVPIPVARELTKQLLIALEKLHAVGVVHTDVKFDNVLASIGQSDADPHQPQTPAEMQNVSSEVFPIPPVMSRPLSNARPLIDAASVPYFVVADFGTSAFADGYHAEIIQPVALRAPEVVIGCDWDTKADIWNLGCLVFEMVTGKWLFKPKAIEKWSAEAYHLANIVPIVEESFSPDWVCTGKHYQELFAGDGKPRLSLGNPRSIEQLLAVYGIHDKTLVSFLRASLRLHPWDRATAAELLSHEWITNGVESE